MPRKVIQNARKDVKGLSPEFQNGGMQVFRFFAVVLLSLMMASPIVAHDADGGEVVIGWITGVDELSDEIILDNGRSFVVSADIYFQMLSPGTRVMLTFVSTPWGRVIAEIIPAPQMKALEAPLSGV